MVHGSTDQGVLKRQIAITLLEEPIKFKEDGYNVRVMVTLAATDSDSHMEILQAMSQLFSEQDSVQNILNARTENEIYDLFIHATEDK